MKHLVSINDLSLSEIEDIYKLTYELKQNPLNKLLKDKSIAMIFEKPSNRTRVSFEVGIFELGGNAISLQDNEIQLGKRESIADAAKTLSRYVDAVIIRTFDHKNIIEFAKYSDVPVINALSDFSHPCQALSDIFTIKEKRKNLDGLKFVFVGDGNNVARSLNLLCKKMGISFVLSCPKKYEIKDAEIEYNPHEAVKNADVIYTDVWASMGQEKEHNKRKKIFSKYQINSKLVNSAKKDVLIMHCLPAHRGEEITADVIDGPNSIVFDQAENRLHVQKAILVKLLKEQ